MKTQETPHYNGQKPYVLVDIGDDEPGRGDSNGYNGLAERIAKKTGAEFRVVDHGSLLEMYPQVRLTPRRYSNDLHEMHMHSMETLHTLRLRKLFEQHGTPDFFFSRSINPNTLEYLTEKGISLVINSFNEQLSSALHVSRANIVPHHLTAAKLAWEGRKFAEEYAELPRPFIGINISDIWGKDLERLVRKMASLKDGYDTATFFVTSCHRTMDSNYDEFMAGLKKGLGDKAEAFPVIGFNYRLQHSFAEKTDLWNPYIGLIDQADHLVIAGDSQSMMSEPLVKGKSIYTTESLWYMREFMRGYLKSIFLHKSGAPLKSATIPAIDLAEDCADALIHKREMLFEKDSLLRSFMDKLPAFISPRVPKGRCKVI